MLPFTRQLGARSGVQLNYRIDNTEGFAGGNEDQTAATVGRFQRGRIDKAFRVNRSNYRRILGSVSSIAASDLNETYVQLYEFFRAGGYEAVVGRLTTEDAVNAFMVCKSDAVDANVWVVDETPDAGYLFYIKHHECFNDGVTAEVNAITAYDTDGVTKVASKEVVLVLKDISGAELFRFAGSLDPNAKDDSNKSRYLPDVVTQFTDNLTIVVAANASVATTAAFYGKDVDGAAKFSKKHLNYFTEGGTGYAATDYDRVIDYLLRSEFSFGYIGAGGSKVASLITKLIALGKEMNKQVVWDIPNSYTPAQAIVFYNSVGGTDSEYSQCYWSPLLHDDPVNGGKAYIGKSFMNLGFRCLRNAQTDANGIAPKNYPVAGKAYPITSSGVSQVYMPSEQELDDLAESRINPVISVRYNSGARYVFADSLTGAKSESIKKLINVADMSCQVDDWMAAYAQECLQLPMKVATKKMTDFMQKLFESLEAAGWIVPSEELEGRSFVGNVVANSQRPYDRLDVTYSLRYDGTTRAIYVTQTYAK